MGLSTKSNKKIFAVSFNQLNRHVINNAVYPVSTLPLNVRERNNWRRLLSKLANFFLSQSYKTTFLAFLINLVLYLYDRLRVFFILLSVSLELIFSWFESLKKILVKRLFWGRGFLFQYVVNVFGVGLLFVIFLSYNYHYRNSIYDSSPVFAEGNNSSGLKEDLIVERTSTNTQTPENRGRVDLVKYVVRSGDTLSKIAQFYGISVDTIMWANNLSAVHVLRPGETLLIPPDDGILIKVKKGDTVESIAKKYAKYHVSPQAIVDANLLEYPFSLEPGQTLFIPNAKPAQNRIYARRAVTPVQTSIVKYPVVHVASNVNRFVGWPVAGGRGVVTQCYWAWHNGVDIADAGAPDLVAAAPGVVVFAGCQSGSCPPPGVPTGGYGLAWAVRILHPNGYSTVYGHMNKIYVKAGQHVEEGQPIGQMGQTGTAYGIHVHFMVTKGTSWHHVNPAMFMKRHICGY